MRILLFVFLTWSVAGLSADRPRLLVVGDSLSAGYGLATGESWTALLQEKLDRLGYPHRVINASISGDTTRGGLARLPRALTIHQPEIVVIELGGNDGLRALPPDEIRRNLDGMVALSQERGAEVIITGIRVPPNYGPVYAEKFQAAFRSVAEERQVPLTPFVLEGIALEPGMMQEDGIHPTAAAQPTILQNLWPWIEPLLAPAEETSAD